MTSFGAITLRTLPNSLSSTDFRQVFAIEVLNMERIATLTLVKILQTPLLSRSLQRSKQHCEAHLFPARYNAAIP